MGAVKNSISPNLKIGLEVFLNLFSCVYIIDRFYFKMGEYEIQICKEFKYLGVVFAKSRSFCKTKKHNYDQAKKAMHLLYRRIRNLNLPNRLSITAF